MKSKKMLGNIKAVPFLFPFFVVYVLFTVFPMLKGLQMSLYEWTLIKQMDFVGIANYSAMFKDSQFWQALWNTTFFVLLSSPLMVVLALILALLANMRTKFRTFLRGSYFLPSILSVSVISFLAIFMLQPYTGFINSLLHLMGSKAEPFWLADKNLVWVSIISVTLWWTVGFNMILYLASLQDIPDFLYEAGKIDGATDGQLFRYVTLPLLAPITRVILLLQIIASYKVFSQIWLITKGGPGITTRPIIQYIYETGFKNNDLGYAATMSYALFVILLAIAFIQLKLKPKEEV
ncbi:ABC transporter permease subunit [Paenibacillus sp. LMG 31456]|uniref:ABC transporter permease subunit n=1 Tax=Paenibacillus foliorum TaxID=2654974 RepID=A0A972K143_9BACL|nr:sugar ABC transporter permease [Paenibacillus foliorum]NOU96309.1 ABC transporter permease subunit [Paenibacillus foliorum]